ncbi:tetratricopeptide repeat protein [Duganella sp. BJB488]|uniref:tetratricopeptide repeat protein n=1 Tax=unclassified Duganella TaxID=2636909 RepID=UPI000E346C2E|nr:MULTISPECIES: tetratricopeptide repeat protein [unclassified Duganella]RFP09139.1 tetratricopeptide repeat protein [Duganella sp. BJB489]RFP12570.1 tetratricopeptide repeat protein [Duganella sp. BJB488]RFP29136.1 tetratricopeptide repeat protein [Duganella sp. BJB480]
MFKRLLSALSGKKTEASDSPPVTEARPGGKELITVYDVYGHELNITRNEWHDKMFLPSLKQNWNDPDELYRLIFSGLDDGFPADLQRAAQRLLEIETMPERGHTMLGIVLLRNGQFDAAEATLRAGMEKVGETGTLLTNLAKVQAERGDEAQADETLWRAVQADPNQENGLMWWASIQRERDGEPAYLKALQTAAALPGSWCPQLWLARHHLEKEEFAAARALYEDVLQGGRYDRGALTMMSSDMGSSGQIPLMLELVGPAFDEHHHDPMAGLNLLRACQALGKLEAGEALLNRMYALGLPPIKQHLDQFAEVFERMRAESAHATPLDEADMEVVHMSLTRPIWQYGLRDADWLFAGKPDSAPEIGFFALTKITDGTGRVESQREDDLGRESRAIPLYLAEAAHYWSAYAASCNILIVEGNGPVLSGTETDAQALFDIMPARMKYIVTGEVGCTGEGQSARWSLALHLWDCGTRTKQVSERGSATEDELSALVLSLEERLLAHIGHKRERPLDAFYQRPTFQVMGAYLTELGQSFMLHLLASGHMPKSAMWGERSMLDWPLTMALHWSAADVPKLMYLSTLGKARGYQSHVLPEYKERSLELLRDTGEADSVASRVAPFVWALFGMTDELGKFIQDQPADANPAYVAWLKRIAE